MYLYRLHSDFTTKSLMPVELTAVDVLDKAMEHCRNCMVSGASHTHIHSYLPSPTHIHVHSHIRSHTLACMCYMLIHMYTYSVLLIFLVNVEF